MTQEMRDKTAFNFIPTLNFVEDSNNATFFSNKMGILIICLNNINFDDVNFDENDPGTITHVRLIGWRNKFKQHKLFKKI